MKMEVINGRETVESWVKRKFHKQEKSPSIDVVAWWRSETGFGSRLNPALVHKLLRRCTNEEIKELKNFLQQKVESSRFLVDAYQRQLNAVEAFCQSLNIQA